MCTVVISKIPRDPLGYVVASNRDEALTRSPALPPRAIEGDVVAPVDPEGGGSWIAANRRGMTVTLLNAYQADARRAAPVDAISRGRIVLDLCRLASLDDLVAALPLLELPRLRPFTLVAVAPGERGPRGVSYTWDGGVTHLEALTLPALFVSSSVDPEGARRDRRRVLAGLLGPRGQLPTRAHMSSHWPTPGPTSVCMHRDDAETRSYTRVEVTPEAVRLSHYPGPPCQGGAGTTVTLCRESPSSRSASSSPSRPATTASSTIPTPTSPRTGRPPTPR